MTKNLSTQTRAGETQDGRNSQPGGGRQLANPSEGNSVFSLQRTLGNQAMLQLLESGGLQAKLRVSQPGDADEEEADRAAEQIISQESVPRSPTVLAGGDGVPKLQRKCACGGTCASCQEEEEQVIHRSARGTMPALRSFPFSIQRQAATTTTTDEASHRASAAEAGARKDQAKHPGEHPRTLVVEDDAESVGPGQMRKREFVSLLQATTCATADAVLESVGHTTKGCPYIKKWLNHYKDQDAAHLMRAMHKYAPETVRARSAHEAIALVNQRVERAALQWAKTGKATDLPEGLQEEMAGGGGFLGAVMGFAHSGFGSALLGFLGGGGRQESGGGRKERKGSGAGAGARVQKKSRNGASADEHDAAAVKEQLGSGQSLDGRVQSRMSSAFGYNFSGVRVHTDAKAGELSGQLNARAFTIGRDVAFAQGEYRPGTLIGDALIAHELAHVVQQGGGNQSDGPQTKDASLGDDSSLEQDADRSAVGAVTAAWTGTKTGLAEISANALPRLKSGLQLQRCSSKKPGPDLHAGAKRPKASTITDIQSVLNPTSTGGGGVPIPWDGHQTGPVLTPAETAARDALKTELTDKLNDHMTANMPAINDAAALRRLPIASLEGAGKGAKRVVDRHFGQYTAAAAFTPTQESTQRAFQFKAAAGPGKTLFDANDPAQRAAAGIPVDADDLASWIAETDTDAQTVQAAHHFNKNRSLEEGDFLRTEILDPFVAANRSDLEKYDLFGFALTREKVVVGTTVEPGFSDVSIGGEPSPAERAAKWSVWKTLVHEYLHTRTHPTFRKAARGNRILIEGFTELFTKETLLAEIPKAPADAALRKEVEGGEFSPPTPAIIGPYDPGSYKDYLDGAEKLRNTAIGPPGGEAAVRDAYFLGHVEYLGLSPTGAVAAPVPPGSNDLITLPPGITTLSALAAAANVSEAAIRTANPGLVLPLPAQLHVPGATDHVVVTAKNVVGPPSPKSENKSQIATQHGISEKALERANPGLNWTTLAEGQHVLIPKH